ncbi:hypothetical protein ACN4EG_15050, partial [Alkalinema pantanalense CENA528]|uniref:hypothetical protein n=1 Tax=Alkalinema pantanalense TaxID=1620705 RepID=UPI003D6F82EC
MVERLRQYRDSRFGKLRHRNRAQNRPPSIQNFKHLPILLAHILILFAGTIALLKAYPSFTTSEIAPDLPDDDTAADTAAEPTADNLAPDRTPDRANIPTDRPPQP